MSLKPEDSTPNSLGLDLDSLKISEDKTSPPPQQTSQKPADKPSNDTPKDTQPSPVAIPADAPIAKEDDAKSPTSAAREKKKPYVNPDRVKTGGAQRDKLTEEELTERMVRIREQNEKIKQRREDVKKDEDEFRKMQEAERIKQAKAKKVQENVNRTREQNARRKMEKIGSREWDSGKQGGQWKDTRPPTSDDQEPTARDGPSEIAPRGGRDGGRGRGRGRGRGGGSGPAPGPAPQAAAPQAAADDPKPDTKTNNTAAPVVAAKDS